MPLLRGARHRALWDPAVHSEWEGRVHSHGEVSSTIIHGSSSFHAGMLPTFSMASGGWFMCRLGAHSSVVCFSHRSNGSKRPSSGTHQAPGFWFCSTEADKEDHWEGIFCFSGSSYQSPGSWKWRRRAASQSALVAIWSQTSTSGQSVLPQWLQSCPQPSRKKPHNFLPICTLS